MLIRLLSVALVMANIAFQAMAAPHAHVVQNGSSAAISKHLHVAGHEGSGHSHSKSAVDDSPSRPVGSNAHGHDHDADAIYFDDLAYERSNSASAIDMTLISRAFNSLVCWSDALSNAPTPYGVDQVATAAIGQTRDLYLVLRTLRI